jgi:N utilization substance protein A
MLRRLLEVEVPEIYNGLVEIKAIAREAGSRAKVAVAALQQGIDPVGACVGMRGVRIQSIVSELNGEKIDVIAWSSDPREFIGKSLSPARPVGAQLADDDEKGRTATVIVPDKELSLAIGREGQNARLAAKLTGWRIDIIGATEAAERAVRRAEEEAIRAAARAEISENMPLEKLGLSRRVVNALSAVGATELGQLLDLMEEGDDALLEIKGFGDKSLQDLKQILKEREVLDILGREPKPETTEEAPEPAGAPATAPPTEAEVALQEEADSAEAGDEVDGAAEEAASQDEEREEERAEALQPAAEEVATPVEPHPVPEPGADSPFEDEQSAKKKRPVKRLVYDENLGEVIAKKVRKPGRRREEWDDTAES